jgi:pyruvate/2-oxoglutarate dehydrogenase complex dihydrolipoamide dehydrogenase (E3) component
MAVHSTSVPSNFDLIVVGGGPAGVVSALRACELGARVALVERGKMGGVCTNDGCVPTRVLARAARLVREAEQFSEYGLDAPLPTLDFPRLMARAQQVIYQVHEKKQLLNHLHQAEIQVFDQAGVAHFVDSHTLALNGGKHLQAEKFILCAGGRPRRLPFPGAELALTHSDVWSLRKLPRSLVIVGSAATGSQLASIFAALGSQVSLLDINHRILGIEDPSISAAIHNAFEQRGIQIVTSISGIERIEKVGDDLHLVYTKDDQTLPIQTEAVIMAVGWVGNVEELNLEAASVKHERGYILVNDYLQTYAGHIFAAGDITGRMMLVQSANHDGRIAAENAVLGVGQPYRHEIVPHGGFTDPEYGSVGLTEQAALEQFGKDGYSSASVSFRELDRAVIDGHTEGLCKLIVSTENHRILGAHVVGEQALEVVEIIAAGMSAGMWVEQLADLEIAYPTYCGISGLAARRIVQTLGVLPLAAQWRGLGRLPLAEWERHDE